MSHDIPRQKSNMELEKSGDLEGGSQGVDTGTIVDIESKLIIIDAHLQKHLRQLQRRCEAFNLPQYSITVRFPLGLLTFLMS